MNEMFSNIGERLVIKARVVNLAKRENEYSKNFRECPVYSEFVGMIEMLKTMQIDYDIDWNYDVTQMTSITVMGKKFEV